MKYHWKIHYGCNAYREPIYKTSIRKESGTVAAST